MEVIRVIMIAMFSDKGLNMKMMSRPYACHIT